MFLTILSLLAHEVRLAVLFLSFRRAVETFASVACCAGPLENYSLCVFWNPAPPQWLSLRCTEMRVSPQSVVLGPRRSLLFLVAVFLVLGLCILSSAAFKFNPRPGQKAASGPRDDDVDGIESSEVGGPTLGSSGSQGGLLEATARRKGISRDYVFAKVNNPKLVRPRGKNNRDEREKEEEDDLETASNERDLDKATRTDDGDTDDDDDNDSSEGHGESDEENEVVVTRKSGKKKQPVVEKSKKKVESRKSDREMKVEEEDEKENDEGDSEEKEKKGKKGKSRHVEEEKDDSEEEEEKVVEKPKKKTKSKDDHDDDSKVKKHKRSNNDKSDVDDEDPPKKKKSKKPSSDDEGDSPKKPVKDKKRKTPDKVKEQPEAQDDNDAQWWNFFGFFSKDKDEESFLEVIQKKRDEDNEKIKKRNEKNKDKEDPEDSLDKSWWSYLNRWPFNYLFELNADEYEEQTEEEKTDTEPEKGTPLDMKKETKKTGPLSTDDFEEILAYIPSFVPNYTSIENIDCRRQGQIFHRQLRGQKLWAFQSELRCSRLVLFVLSEFRSLQ